MRMEIVLKIQLKNLIVEMDHGHIQQASYSFRKYPAKWITMYL